MRFKAQLSKSWRIVRFTLATVLFVWSWMVFLPASRMPLFYLALGATEFGHWFAVGCLVLALLGPHRSRVDFAALLIALAAAGIYASSGVRASLLARTLPEEFTRAFASLRGRGDELMPSSPFSWGRLWEQPPGDGGAVETFEYARHAQGRLQLDFFRCRLKSPAPCVVVIHGGGWDSGGRGEFSDFNRYLAARGYAVAAIDYRLAPQFPWPAQQEDVGAALRYLGEHAAALGIDPLQMVLLGRSAGGQIAEAVAYGTPHPAVRGCVALYAPADLNFAFAYADPGDILNSLQLLKGYLGGTPAEVPANYDSASGILQVSKHSVPTLLMHGRRDELVWCRQSERLAARLQEVGAPHLLVELPWATHAFDYNLSGPGGQLAGWTVDQFLATVTRRATPPAVSLNRP